MPSPKAASASRRALGHRLAEADRPAHDAHAPSPAAGRGLDQQRPAQRVELVVLGELVPSLDGMAREGRVGTPAARMSSLEPDLRAHGVDGRRRGTHPGEAGPGHHPGEVARLGQEAVAGVDGVGPGPGGGVEDEGRAQVGVGRGVPGQAHGQVGLPDVGAVGVGVGVDGHRGHAHGPGRAHDASGDLAPVGHQQGADGGDGWSGRVTAGLTSGTRRSHGSPRWVGCR